MLVEHAPVGQAVRASKLAWRQISSSEAFFGDIAEQSDIAERIALLIVDGVDQHRDQVFLAIATALPQFAFPVAAIGHAFEHAVEEFFVVAAGSSS
jgi:hypothetical protein